jgi:hypothetical protein
MCVCVCFSCRFSTHRKHTEKTEKNVTFEI